SPPDLCLVVGDVNSTMACAIAAKKMGVRGAHVESGIRSGDWSMPEEINRVVTDSTADWHFTTPELASANLLRGGVDASRIFLVGNTMIDSLLANLPRLRKPAFWDSKGLGAREYLLLTLHRPANVDDEGILASRLAAICNAAGSRIVVFPVHPR